MKRKRPTSKKLNASESTPNEPSESKRFLPRVRHGIAIDLLIVLANLIIVPVFWRPVFSPLVDHLSSGEAPFILMGLVVVVFVGRLGGLYLKRYPLQVRLAGAPDAGFPLYFFIFNFALMVLTGAGVLVAMQAMTGAKESPGLAFVGIFCILFACGFELYLLYRLSAPLTKSEQTDRETGAWAYTPACERVANFGLALYVLFYQVVYFMAAELFMTPPGGWGVFDLGMIVVSVIFVAIYFILFYMAPRAVFLIEDRKYLGTWVFIFLVFVTSMTRHLL